MSQTLSTAPEVMHEARPERPLRPLIEPAVPVPGKGEGQDEYLPRSQLSVAPRPLGQIMIPFPKEFIDEGRFTTVLALYIDEAGVVRRVRVDGSAIHPLLEHAAKQAFSQARFSPGERDGQPVRSMIRIEVDFDNRPADATR